MLTLRYNYSFTLRPDAEFLPSKRSFGGFASAAVRAAATVALIPGTSANKVTHSVGRVGPEHRRRCWRGGNLRHLFVMDGSLTSEIPSLTVGRRLVGGATVRSHEAWRGREGRVDRIHPTPGSAAVASRLLPTYIIILRKHGGARKRSSSSLASVRTVGFHVDYRVLSAAVGMLCADNYCAYSGLTYVQKPTG